MNGEDQTYLGEDDSESEEEASGSSSSGTEHAETSEHEEEQLKRRGRLLTLLSLSKGCYEVVESDNVTLISTIDTINLN